MKKINILLSIIALQLSAVAQVQLGNLKASPRSNAFEISWTALAETGIARHEIERSANGSAFHTVGTLVAQNNGTSYKYAFTDATPVQGLNYYRIRTVNNSGDVNSSNVLTADMSLYKAGIKILGNPVQNGIVNLQMNNLEKGKYIITLHNSVGQQVFNYSFDHPGGTSTRVMNLPGNIGKGTHVLLMTDGLTRYNQQVVVM